MNVKQWIYTYDDFNEFYDIVEKYGHLKIQQEFHMHDEDEEWKSFPQTSFNYRNVCMWVLLEDGSAIGLNESPRSGWSFPRIGKKTVQKNM